MANWTSQQSDIMPSAGAMSPYMVERMKARPFQEQNLDLPLKYILQLHQKVVCNNTSYFGIQTCKSPLDFWAYQEIIYHAKPDVIIEIGNFYGGSTLALAHILDNMGGLGRIIGIDIDQSKIDSRVRKHHRIHLMEVDAVLLESKVREKIGQGESIMVIEDSSHEYCNTLNVMNFYAPLVTNYQYLIVEDSFFGSHGIDVGPRPGSYEAIEKFMSLNSGEFAIDRRREAFLLTHNPKGFLVRVRGAK